MARIDDLFNYLQTPGLTDQQIAAEIGRLGVTAQEVSQLTGVPVADVQSRLTAVAPVAAPTQQLFNYLQTPNLTDQQIAAEIGRLGVTPQEVSQLTGVPVADIQSRLTAAAPVVTPPAVVRPPVMTAPVVTPVAAAPVVTPPVVRPPVVTAPVVTPPVNNLPAFTTFLKTPGLTDQQIAAEMNRLGITAGQVANLTGVSQNDVQTRFNATAPFSNATQGFAQNFNNYQSIPIGAQFNPAVTAGGASPYSQVMGQMRPVGNPYAGVVGNLSMGGYDPALYERIAAANLARDLAAKGGTTLTEYYGGPGDATSAAAAATAADSAAASAASASGTAPGSDGSPGSGAAKGGMVHGGLMFGPNPPGPDDGAVNLDMGEYVIKKSSVDKYGKGLLDMINEGKVPAKKMKSLLG
jgi:bacterioferritin-associated ferredoxin